MLLDSLTNAKDDIAIRALTEARTEAEQIIFTTNAFLTKNKIYLTNEELTSSQDAITSLQKEMLGVDKNTIQKEIEHLNEITRPFAERVMDIAISEAMIGTKV
jgi:molecular chaperone HscA